jgi:putative ABC transport system permease protein
MGELWSDVAYGLRMLARKPGATLVCALALALGIGGTTTCFSVADALVFKPIPLPDSHGIVMVVERSPRSAGWNTVAPANYFDWKNTAASFSELAAFRSTDATLTGDGEAEWVSAHAVDPGLFTVVRTGAKLGRTLIASDAQPGSSRVVVLSHGLWERKFASDPRAIGHELRLNGQNHTIVGVMPAHYDFPLSTELWMPLVLTPEEKQNRGAHYLLTIGRLKPAVSIRQANAEMAAIAARLSQRYPQTNKGWSATVRTIKDTYNGDYTSYYTILLIGVSAFVLLIACSNVANMQLAKATVRAKEIAIRSALGSGRWRVARQLLIESLLLAALGATLGVLFAQWMNALVVDNMPARLVRLIPGWQEIALDVRSLLFAIGLAVAAGVISGLAPAIHSSRTDVNETLKEGGRGGTAAGKSHRIRSMFVVAEVSLALVLLIGASLMVKGFRTLVNLGDNLEPEKILTLRLSLPEAKYKDAPAQARFWQDLLRGLDGISRTEAAVVSALPYSGSRSDAPVSIEGAPESRPGEDIVALQQSVSPKYFRVMRLPVKAGRAFSDSDAQDAPKVAIVSESFVRRAFPGGTNPIGKRVKTGRRDSQAPWFEIVGVAADVMQNPYDRVFQPTLYRPLAQAPRRWMQVAVRNEGPALAAWPAVRVAIANVDREQPVHWVRSMKTAIDEQMIGLTYVSTIMMIAGILALILAAVGIYGVIAYIVSERTHEIGIRMALGADRGDVVRATLKRGMLLTALGMALGLPVAFGLARLMAGLIFGVGASDLATFTAIPFVLIACAAAACYVPARRAASVDPVVALRHD